MTEKRRCSENMLDKTNWCSTPASHRLISFSQKQEKLRATGVDWLLLAAAEKI